MDPGNISDINKDVNNNFRILSLERRVFELEQRNRYVKWGALSGVVVGVLGLLSLGFSKK